MSTFRQQAITSLAAIDLKPPWPRHLRAVAATKTAALITLLLILPSQAQGFSDRHGLPKDLNPITRQGFAWINDLGGGVDDRGFYRRPVNVRAAFGIDLPNGWHRAPWAWDPENAFLFYVENGWIIRQDYAPFQ